ncbi:MAG TPA: hypothetical protein VIG32_00630 [Candidatus Baltobacteraceae bacterium]|jgi:hypothetical protein
MTLGEIARVARGVVTGNSKLFVMTRAKATEHGLEQFVKPVLGGSTAFPKNGIPVVRDGPDRHVLLVVSAADVDRFPALRAYLGGVAPKVVSPRFAPIAASYVGVPRFIANPDGLIITNSLYAVTPRQSMSAKDVVALVERLNETTAKLSKPNATGAATRYTPRTLEALEI